MDKRDIGLLAVLFLIAFFVWSLPFQKSQIPFGEGDAAWHFANGDYIYEHDQSVTKLPDYIDFWYFNYNSMLGRGAIQYPPPNHLDYAMLNIIGGDRFLPYLMFRAIASFLSVFSVYFLIRKLYGIAPAFIASFGLIFSTREAMLYLFGQQPSLISFTFIPLALYAFYSYYTSLYEKEKPVYLYLLTAIVLAQFLLHLQGLIVTAAILPFSALLLTIKERKIPRFNFKHLIICAAIFSVFLIQFGAIYLGVLEGNVGPADRDILHRIISLELDYSTISGAFPQSFISFTAEYAIYLVPFLLLGIIFLLLRRSSKDLLMLSWIAGIYVVMHLDIFANVGEARVARMGVAEAQLFYSLIALGIVFLVSFAKQYKTQAKYAASAIFIILIVSTTGKSVYEMMDNAYGGIARLNPEQIAAAGWIDKNLPNNAIIYDAGTLNYPKIRWMLALSRRHVLKYEGEFKIPGRYETAPLEMKKGIVNHNYVMIDYSDMRKINNQQSQQVEQQLQVLEKQINKTAVYDANSIKIYDFGEKNEA